MSTYFLGIDPGVSGGIAVITSGRVIERLVPVPVVELPKTPRSKIRSGKKVVVHGTRRELDFSAVARLFNEIRQLGDVFGVVESVTPSVGRLTGATSAFSFGGAFWALRQALASAGIMYQLVSPQRWQTGLLGGANIALRGDKKASGERRKLLQNLYVAKAIEMFALDTKPRPDLAAALLLAEYARLRFVAGGTDESTSA